MAKRLLTDYFRHDHERLDQLFQLFCDARANGQATATQCFRQFQQAQLRHIDVEERLMFPLYESRGGQSGHQPIEGMWREHRELQRLIAAINEKLTRTDSNMDGEIAELRRITAAHHDSEELIVYPLIDDTLSEADRNRLFAQMEECQPGGN